MSTEEATKTIKKQIEDTLAEYTRGTLDSQVHVIDISYNSLLASNKQEDTQEYRDNYKEFLSHALNLAHKVTDYSKGVARVNKNLGTCYLEEAGHILLISKNFGTARDFITKISDLVKDNPDFGVAFRTRNYADIETSRKFSRAKNSLFIINNASGYGVSRIQKMPNSRKYGLVPVPGLQNIKQISYLPSPSAEPIITTNVAQFNNLEVELGENNIVKVRQRGLSALDLGHGQGRSQVQATPLGQKLETLLSMQLSPSGQALVTQYMNELVDAHNIVDFEFRNTSTDSKASGYVIISIQNYKRNNVLSVIETGILTKLRRNIEELLPNIPGSNTIPQDGIEIIRNKVVAALQNKAPKPIAKHPNKVIGKAKPKITVRQPDKTKVTTKRQVQIVDPVKLSGITEQVNLTSLQALINRHLQDVISANMGDGSSRNVLNYRTGRFAASATVERMSQSRAGMITAFYNYMKNPYQTFEPGYRQGSPKSRDPKLLISKSIREIAASKVGNRLRAVLV